MRDKLTEFQVSHFKKLLLTRCLMLRDDVCKELSSFNNEAYQQLVHAINALMDGILITCPVDIKNDGIDRYLNEFNDLSSAFQRIQKGCFGVCTGCELSIAFKRLLVYPTAKRCIVCQRLYEKSGSW